MRTEAEVKEAQRLYREAIATFTPRTNSNSPNYIRLMEFAKANGYIFANDISYNGFIHVEKTICDGDSKINLKVYDGIIKTANPAIEILNLEADFGNIMDETKHRFKKQRGLCLDPKNLDELFELALKKEAEWEAEWAEILAKEATK